MAASGPASERSSWLNDFNSMMVSASSHFMALIVLGLITVASTRGIHSDSIVMELGDGGGGPAPGDGNDLGMPEGAQLDDPAQLQATPDVAAAIGPANPNTEINTAASLASSIDIPDSLPVTLDDPSGGGGTSVDSKGGTESEVLAKFGIVDGKGRGGGGNGDGTSRRSTDFFGIGGYGQTFVYVVDASDSMNDNSKFERARTELLKSIKQLQSNQKFFVIFYNEGAYPMDADKPLEASPANIEAVTSWIRNVEPTGGTNPLPALIYALSLHPDAIYFLSDGRFDPYVTVEMRSRNRQNLRLKIKQVPIHTIAFYDRIAESLMRMIARNSAGEYKFVQ